MNSTISLYGIDIKRVLFVDIETVPAYPDYSQLPGEFKKFWDDKASKLKRDEGATPSDIYDRAGIYSEFGKIICISTGYVKGEQFLIKSFFDDSESDLLENFAKMINRLPVAQKWMLCAHNGKEFDFPYIGRRMLVNGTRLPDMLDLSSKKPWEVNHLDTMELWKFGDYKNYTSLNLLCSLFGIKTPKDDIDGSMVAKVYWEEKNLERIVRYCQKDTYSIACLLMRFKGMQIIQEQNIVFL
jgi:3'-5' exonuclease